MEIRDTSPKDDGAYLSHTDLKITIILNRSVKQRSQLTTINASNMVLGLLSWESNIYGLKEFGME